MTVTIDSHDRILALLHDALHVEVTSSDADLLEEGFLDSLGIVELLFRLEQEFGIRIDLAEVELAHFRSVREIAQLVEARTAA